MAEEMGVYVENGKRLYSFGKSLMLEPGTPVKIYFPDGKVINGKKVSNETLNTSRVIVVEGEDGYMYNAGRHVANVEIGPID